MKPRSIQTALVILAACSLSVGHAHWISPAPRTGENVAYSPCGNQAPGIPSDTVQAGDTLTVQWQEYEDHNLYYHINLSSDSDRTFQSLLITADTAVNGTWTRRIRMPFMTTRRVTLQMVQGTYYYSCMDILLLDSGTTDRELSLPQEQGDALTLTSPVSKGESVRLLTRGTIPDRVALFDVQGRKLLEIPWPAAGKGLNLQLPNLPGGTYLVCVQTGGRQEVRRLVIR